MDAKRRSLLFVLHSLSIGGAERLTAAMAEALSNDDNFKIGILCLDSRGALWEECERRGYALYLAERKPGWQWGPIAKTARVIREFSPDIIHAQQYTPYLYAALGKLIARSRARLIFTEHGRHFPDVVSFKRRLANRLLVPLTDAVTAVSDFSKTALIEQEGISSPPVQVIYNGLAKPNGAAGANLRKELELPRDAKIIGCVGSLRPVKNPLFLLRAFAKLKETGTDAQLVYIGDGPLREELSAEISRLGLTGSVYLLGVRSPASPYFRDFDIFVLPSHCEAASLALLEAMSLGLPCIATDRGGSPELIEHERSGVLVSCGDIEQLAACLQSLLENPAQARALGAAAQRRFDERFTFESMMARYREVYERAS